MRLAVTYDVSNDTNRRHVYRTLERYGAWRQYSVFELEITKREA
ncbi:CRISPR-associated endonuclease Cas2 [Haloterrigena alkaliphila]|nr:CRISPR-associated endonuclease Cas2 [Haloterrigena alkaliphila]UHQ95039.1 CRISPR-associated endonuclease Cas2 [Haloterrigena alkaliphila]